MQAYSNSACQEIPRLLCNPKVYYGVVFEVLTAASMKMAVFWVVALQPNHLRLLWCSQQPATGPNPKPVESSPRSHILFNIYAIKPILSTTKASLTDGRIFKNL
jgi:hypothetical protein